MIAVIGGAGYIGSHAVVELIRAGCGVLAIDNLQTGHRGALHPDAVFVQGDIRDRGFLDQVFKTYPVEGVVHFAANSLVGESMENPLKYFSNNVHGTEVLLAAMQAAGIKKLVFSSSAAVYGNIDRDTIQETDPARPASAYGESKLMMEQMMKWCEQAYGIQYISLRYFNVAGADETGTIGEDHAPETHLIPLVLQVPLGKRAEIAIYGNDYATKDGTCIRDYIHVTDLVKAHILALEYLSTHEESQIINLGSGEGYSVLEILEAARRVTGHPIPSRITERRPGDPDRLVASARKAEALLGWKPAFTRVEDIIASAWKWHQNTPQGFEKEV